MANTQTALPITLVSFDVSKHNSDVELIWITATEIRNDYFTIERSTDGYNFTEILTHEGAGYSEKVLEYVVYDNAPAKGLNYYRLSQTDFDGTTEYFETRVVDFGISDEMVTIYPNPASDIVNVRLENLPRGEYNIQLVTQLGQVVKNKNVSILTNTSVLNFEILDGQILARSTYFIKVRSEKWHKVVPSDCRIIIKAN